MEQTLARSFAHLERRIALMQQLAGSLTEAQAAVLSMDVSALDAHTARQEQLCEQLRALRDVSGCEEISAAGPKDSGSPADRRWTALLQELEKVQADVRRQNRVYAALLHRARRSIAFLTNVLASSAGSYCAPPLPENVCPAMTSRK